MLSIFKHGSLFIINALFILWNPPRSERDDNIDLDQRAPGKPAKPVS
jgi:hypothetical protein